MGSNRSMVEYSTVEAQRPLAASSPVSTPVFRFALWLCHNRRPRTMCLYSSASARPQHLARMKKPRVVRRFRVLYRFPLRTESWSRWLRGKNSGITTVCLFATPSVRVKELNDSPAYYNGDNGVGPLVSRSLRLEFSTAGGLTMIHRPHQ